MSKSGNSGVCISDINVDIEPSCPDEAHACNCKRPYNPEEKGCGDDCLNRCVKRSNTVNVIFA